MLAVIAGEEGEQHVHCQSVGSCATPTQSWFNNTVNQPAFNHIPGNYINRYLLYIWVVRLQ